MQTEIKNISDVELELEIKATADDLNADIETAVRAQRARTNMKGFRPGKVPDIGRQEGVRQSHCVRSC